MGRSVQSVSVVCPGVTWFMIHGTNHRLRLYDKREGGGGSWKNFVALG